MLGYRCVFDVDVSGEQLLAEGGAQVRAWLSSKGYAPDLVVGEGRPLGDGVSGHAVELVPGDGSRTVRFRVVEEAPQGRWTSLLTLHAPPGERQTPWAVLEVHTPTADGDRAGWTGTPRLARHLIEALPVRDGLARITVAPHRVLPGEVDELCEVVEDAGRRGRIFVAGTSEDLPEGEWLALVTRLTRDTLGVATTYFLTAEATTALNARFGPTHGVRPGTVRTFEPGAVVGEVDDGRRHRVLGTHRIVSDHTARLSRMLGWKARQWLMEQALAPAVRRVNDRMDREEDRFLLAPAPPTARAAEPRSPDVSELVRLAEEGRAAALRESAVLGRLDEVRTELEAETSRRVETSRRLEDELLEHLETQQRNEELEARNRYLEALLLTSSAASEVYADARTDHVPDSFDELLVLKDEFAHLEFTCDEETAAVLDDKDPSGIWARKTWRILETLDDYVRATLEGRCDRDVESYLKETPAGFRGYSVNKHASTESKDVQNNPRFAAARVFTVPVSVDPAGEMQMMSHFKIAQSGQVSPRLYYYDDSRGTGKVYVGYIGPHLPTKRTN
jgi:hypothetical protein